MITSVLLAALAQVPANAVFAYTGIPMLESNQGPLEMRSHSATLTIRDGMVEGTSVSEVRNPAGKVATVQVRIPLRGYATATDAPSVQVDAVWSGQPLTLVASPIAPAAGDRPAKWTNAASATAYMPPRSTASLRVNFRVPLGSAGLDRMRRVAAYELGGLQRVGQLNVTLKYTEKEVFRLPEIGPALGWQIGAKGAFLRRTDYAPKGDVIAALFYPGGFGD